MAEKLKPCPFCGSTDLVKVKRGEHWQISCIQCDADGPSIFTEIDAPEEQWNSRVVIETPAVDKA